MQGREDLPISTTELNPSAALPPPPDGLDATENYPGVAEFLKTGAELRRSLEPIDGVHAIWCRLRVPVVAGQPLRATSTAAFPLDMVNLLGVTTLDPSRASCLNPDVTGHLFRGPVDDWIAITGHTYFAHDVSHGSSMGVMSDSEGVFGVTSTTQILDVFETGD